MACQDAERRRAASAIGIKSRTGWLTKMMCDLMAAARGMSPSEIPRKPRAAWLNAN